MLTNIKLISGEPIFYLSIALRFIGYAIFLKLWFKDSTLKSGLFALGRTLLGAITSLTLIAFMSDHPNTLYFYIGIIILRFFEWRLLGMYFYKTSPNKNLLRFVSASMLISFVLDAIFFAIGFKIAGGIC